MLAAMQEIGSVNNVSPPAAITANAPGPQPVTAPAGG